MSFPCSFSDFHGNQSTVEALRAAVAAGRMPRSLIIAGARGSGKYTLALMLTMALECLTQPREEGGSHKELASFCGHCRNCVRLIEIADLDARVIEATAAREDLRETDKKETRILIQTHPDVLVLPPDPPQLLIKLGQIRALISRAHTLPAESPKKVFLITSSAFMKEAANSLLKVLEEPPAHTHLIVLTENLSELLPTIRSRCAIVRLGALPHDVLGKILREQRPDLPEGERGLVARLSEGTAGRALAFDMAGYQTARGDALLLLHSVIQTGDHSPLFRMTETYRAGAEGQTKTLALVRATSSLLEDLLLLHSGAPDRIRNVDISRDLEQIGANLDFIAMEAAVKGLDAIHSGMRRNLLRGLSLDAFSANLEGVDASS